MTTNKAKTFNDTFLYYKGDYDKAIFNFLITSERVDKNDPSFENIRYEVKNQQVTHTLSRVLDSNNIILMINESSPMPRAFRVFVGKDPKDKSSKAFIDVTDIIIHKDGVYSLVRHNTTVLISYLISAMNGLIYSAKPEKIISNTDIVNHGTLAFAKLFSYVIDYLRVGGIYNARKIALYMSSLYFQRNILQRDITEQAINRARASSELTDAEIAKVEYYVNTISDIEDPYKNINIFIRSFANVLHIENELTIDIFINKWMMLFGSGTQFSTELYTSFSDMMIHTYTGIPLFRQITIEKVAGTEMVDYVKAILRIGSDVL